ncbi:MAG: uroporphyrinogen decarboxylase family protein [Oscillospiraceae bacterium]|nr:uroporphyrinogen decarboxylase family protein [Oscillospiraceae bacterium]
MSEMTNRQRFNAVLNYTEYDRMPVVHFGFWKELLEKWVVEGYLTQELIDDYKDASPADKIIGDMLGFDFNFFTTYQDLSGFSALYPPFEQLRIKDRPDGSYEFRNEDGAYVLQKEGVRSIPAEIGHTLVDRASWEEHYIPKLQFNDDRFDNSVLERLAAESASRTEPLGIYCKSMFGHFRNWMGIVGISYLYVDDRELYDEIIETLGDLAFDITERALKSGIEFDFAHFWEDICYKNGPLISPVLFDEKAGPIYRRITNLVNGFGINIVSVDCDGMIDSLIPTWIKNGVNTMFPIEVGTWDASIAPWREKYGRELRGVGGVNKHILSRDHAAIDAEIERIKPFVDLGGYIPCLDHRIAPDAKWELVQYYCDQMKNTFS